MNDFKLTENLIITISDYLKIDIDEYDIDDIIYGLNIELEHGSINKITNISNDDIIVTYKIVMAHLMQHKNYYKALAKMLNSLN